MNPFQLTELAVISYIRQRLNNSKEAPTPGPLPPAAIFELFTEQSGTGRGGALAGQFKFNFTLTSRVSQVFIKDLQLIQRLLSCAR